MINTFVDLLQSSIDKCVELKLFKNKKDASFAHLYQYKFELLPMSKFKNGSVQNFKHERLKKNVKEVEEAYPEDNRPKGEYNLEAVKFHRNLITQKINPLIFMAYKKDKYYLIHGSHKLVAAHLEGHKKIEAFVVYI